MTWFLVISLFSLVGLAYVSYGKATSRFAMIVCGVLLMVYPYFISSLLAIILVGAALTALPFVLQW